MVMKKRIVYLVGAILLLPILLLSGCKSGANQNLRVINGSLAVEQYGVGFRLADKALRDQVNGALYSMKQDGTMAKISETWFGKNVTGGFKAISDKATDNSWNQIKQKGKLVIGLDPSFPPMGFKDSKGNIVGFDIDLAKEACKRLGITPVFQPINWDSKDAEMQAHTIDCIWNGFTITADRLKSYSFTSPYMENDQVLVVLQNSKFNSLSDFKGQKIALQKGSSAEDALNNSAAFKASLAGVDEFLDNETAIQNVKIGQDSAVLMDSVVANYMISQQK
jgi:ABC-type amino acid transport substrate-binding protein